MSAVWLDLGSRSFPDALRAARSFRGMTQADVGKVAGITTGAISRIEGGQRPNPTLSTVVGICRALGLEADVTGTGGRYRVAVPATEILAAAGRRHGDQS